MNNREENEAWGKRREKMKKKKKKIEGQRRNPLTKCRVRLVILYPAEADPLLRNKSLWGVTHLSFPFFEVTDQLTLKSQRLHTVPKDNGAVMPILPLI